jgi:hypothetical protein
MPERATVYENYRDVDETTSRHWRGATTLEFFDQEKLSTDIKQMWSKQKYAAQYIFDVGEIIPALTTGIKEYILVTAANEPGVVTYFLGSSILPAIAYDLDQEIEIVVRMSPKAVRDTIVKITGRNKGVPNPIL